MVTLVAWVRVYVCLLCSSIKSLNRWVSPLLIRARKQGSLQITDLCNLPPHLESTTLTNQLEANWLDEIKRNPERPSFLRATLRTMRWKPLFLGLMLIPKVNIAL